LGFFKNALYNNALYAAFQIPDSDFEDWRMLELNPGQLQQSHWLSEAITTQLYLNKIFSCETNS
jgi:hypothetical protein